MIVGEAYHDREVMVGTICASPRVIRNSATDCPSKRNTCPQRPAPIALPSAAFDLQERWHRIRTRPAAWAYPSLVSVLIFPRPPQAGESTMSP
jgi:hypothetical protein